MKNTKFTKILSLIIAIAMIFSTVSISAVAFSPVPVPDYTDITELPTTGAPTTEVPTTEVPTTGVPTTEEPTTEEPTTTPSEEETTTLPEEEEETTEEKSDEYWDGYEDGYEDGLEDGKYEGEYDDGYEDGVYDGYYEGYYDGYYEGYYEAIQDMENKDVVTIFDKLDAFYADLVDRIYIIKYVFVDFIQRIFRTGDYAVTEIAIPDTDFIPDPDQATLAGDIDAAALCDEFNSLINSFILTHEPVTVTDITTVDIEITDCPGGAIVKKIVQPVIDDFLLDYNSTDYFDEDEYVYGFQETYVMPQGLTSAKKTVNEDGTTDYEFKLIAEASFYNGYNTYPVTIKDNEAVEADYFYHYNVADVVIVEAAYLDGITITKGEVVYPGATITAKTDAQGRLVKYDVNMPMRGEATGKAGLIKATVALEGYRNEGFTMVYDI